MRGKSIKAVTIKLFIKAQPILTKARARLELDKIGLTLIHLVLLLRSFDFRRCRCCQNTMTSRSGLHLERMKEKIASAPKRNCYYLVQLEADVVVTASNEQKWPPGNKIDAKYKEKPVLFYSDSPCYIVATNFLA